MYRAGNARAVVKGSDMDGLIVKLQELDRKLEAGCWEPLTAEDQAVIDGVMDMLQAIYTSLKALCDMVMEIMSPFYETLEDAANQAATGECL